MNKVKIKCSYSQYNIRNLTSWQLVSILGKTGQNEKYSQTIPPLLPVATLYTVYGNVCLPCSWNVKLSQHSQYQYVAPFLYGLSMCSTSCTHCRKIRLTEGNTKCRHLNKITCKKGIAAGVYLSDAQNSIPPPP
jgi:hypothetical protein